MGVGVSRSTVRGVMMETGALFFLETMVGSVDTGKISTTATRSKPNGKTPEVKTQRSNPTLSKPIGLNPTVKAQRSKTDVQHAERPKSNDQNPMFTPPNSHHTTQRSPLSNNRLAGGEPIATSTTSHPSILPANISRRASLGVDHYYNSLPSAECDREVYLFCCLDSTCVLQLPEVYRSFNVAACRC